MKEPLPDYTSAFAAKLIYVFRIPDKAHEGFLKIGEATIPREMGDPAALAPNCATLNKAAKARIAAMPPAANQTFAPVYPAMTSTSATSTPNGSSAALKRPSPPSPPPVVATRRSTPPPPPNPPPRLTP